MEKKIVTEPNPPVDTTETELAVLEETVRHLPVPTQAAELIADALNFLAENGAGHQAAVLDDVYDATSTMLQTAQQLDQGFRASLNIAKTLRQQREDARQALADLKKALDEADLNNDDVAQLWEAAEECFNEEQMWYIWDVMYEEVTERIWNSTPLSFEESRDLLNALTEEWIDSEHYLWNDLRDWLRRIKETADTGLCPPPAAD
jgi:hypothetical protein